MGAARPDITAYILSPLPDGGWRAECRETLSNGQVVNPSKGFPANRSTDPDGEAAYHKALDFIDDYRLPSPARDRRTDHELRQAITWLRLCEAKAADHLPDDLMREITSAIDGVVGLLLTRLRTDGEGP